MADNRIEDKHLDQVAGGSIEDIDLNDIPWDDINAIFTKFGDVIKLMREAVETNTCPVCKQQIEPDVTQCSTLGFLEHMKSHSK